MKNKNVGFLVIGIGVIIAILVLIFNIAMSSVIELTCTHGPDCGMYTTLSLQTWISFSIVGIILIIGLFLIFSKEQERIVIKKIKEKAEIKRK
ncbi:MAG TPA: hypothetical protein VI544_02080, partial [Candidatus Nanoarchaeia archaeon]|nr:hypothetical protein [Candidatus Nanoarchaeia archaeon]